MWALSVRLLLLESPFAVCKKTSKLVLVVLKDGSVLVWDVGLPRIPDATSFRTITNTGFQEFTSEFKSAGVGSGGKLKIIQAEDIIRRIRRRV